KSTSSEAAPKRNNAFRTTSKASPTRRSMAARPSQIPARVERSSSDKASMSGSLVGKSLRVRRPPQRPDWLISSSAIATRTVATGLTLRERAPAFAGVFANVVLALPPLGAARRTLPLPMHAVKRLHELALGITSIDPREGITLKGKRRACALTSRIDTGGCFRL